MNKKVLILAGIVWALVVVSGVTYHQLKKSSEVVNVVELEKKQEKVEAGAVEEKINFYVFSENKDKLIKEERTIEVYPRTRDRIRKIAEISFENLWQSKIIGTAQVEIRNIYIKGDMIYIDVDANILELKAENRRNLLAIYSIVNSVTEIGNIRKVKILVDGKEETGSFSKVYTRNTNI